MEQRTQTQNRALHKYFGNVARALNDAGLDYRAVLAENPAEIPWSAALVKELWKAVQELQLGKAHTAELSVEEVSEVYDALNRFLSEKFGIAVSFPSEDSLRFQSIEE